MNKWIKRGVLGVVGLAILGAGGLALGSYLGDRKAARRVEVPVAAVAIPTDAAALERGRYLYASRGCADCHGANGGGKAFIDDGGGLFIKAPNISPGPGGVVAGYTPQDWVRIVRHGVKPSGQPAFVMPSEDYNRLSDADLGALVAHVRQLPPASGTGMVARIPPMVKTLYAAGLIRDAAEKIDHTLPPSRPVVEDGSARHGAYVASMCIGCHGATLAGGKIPGSPPDWPPAANLTPGEGSGMQAYASADQFVAMLRTGKRPDGTEVSGVMPFSSLRELNDADASALYAHLKTLAPLPVGQR
jgi:mono/diheme cytochrome c family protein